MRVPQRLACIFDSYFPTVAIWLRFVKHRVEGNRELTIAREYMKSGSLVIDVGARKGVYTWLMSHRVGDSGGVLAFEPNPENAASLRSVFSSFRNVAIHESALSEQSGRSVLNVPLKGGIAQDSLGYVGHRDDESACLSYDVQMITLDEFIKASDRKVSFIKIDVEGHELSVLRGCKATIVSHRPVFFIEIEQRHAAEPIGSRFDFLDSLDYSIYFLNLKGKLDSIRNFDVEKMQRQPFLLGHHFVNMFLFVPRECVQPTI